MNLILFESTELPRPLPRDDRRARHILDVLRRQPGETFDVGRINGPRGKATLASITPHALNLTFTWENSVAPAPPITLIVGVPRPQTARDILREATSLGVAALHFVSTAKSEPSYLQSTLWSSGEWRRHIIGGAEQAFDPQMPHVVFGRSLEETLEGVPAGALRLALDNYEAPSSLGALDVHAPTHLALAIGAERGWSAGERDLLRAQQFAFVHLGSRVLRTETACIAALSIMRAKCGWM